MPEATSAQFSAGDISIDQALRPRHWEEYVGQNKIKEGLRVMIEATRARAEALDHVLLCGPAGLGKTTLAYLCAGTLGVPVKTTSGPALTRAGDIAAILTNIEPGSVLFIDEIHRMNRMIEEVLYPAMESRTLHVIVGKGVSARDLTVELPPFTLIAATTRENLLSQPLRSRFGATLRLSYYEDTDIITILKRSAHILEATVTQEAMRQLALASRATPRVANRLLKRARDCAQVKGSTIIDENIVAATLELLDIDRRGLEPHDRLLVQLIIEKFHGGPVGLQTLAAAMNEEKGVIEDIYEPYLMSLGFLQRTSAGRIVLPAAYDHLRHKSGNELF